MAVIHRRYRDTTSAGVQTLRDDGAGLRSDC